MLEKGPETEKKCLAQAGIAPTAELVNHCLSMWFRQEFTTAAHCLLSIPAPSTHCKERTKADIDYQP